MARRLLILTLAGSLLFCSALVQAENIYPDPGFEGSGEVGEAHSGERAGHLKVTNEVHWVALGGALEVEPFARYRVSLWAKATPGQGSAQAPYCYEWDNYVWAFTGTQSIPADGGWHKLEATFVSPYDHMVVHPAAMTDCADREVWVDDIVVEKIGEPDETMDAMMANDAPGPDELRTIARYLLDRQDWDRRGAPLNIPLLGKVFQDRLEAVRALLGVGPSGVSADIACLLAQNAGSQEERNEYVVEMVKYGGLTLNWGMRRFNESTEGLTEDEKLALCVAAVTADPTSVGAAKGLRMVAEQVVPTSGGTQTTTEAAERLEALAHALEDLTTEVDADSAAGKELVAVAETVEAQRERLAEMQAKLGSATIKVGGKPVMPETHVIAIPDEPTPQEQHAAKDFRLHLELVTGNVIDIVSESDVGERTPIIVGLCGLLEGHAFDVVPVDLGLEGIYIGTRGPVLALVGNKRGVLYATYTFLEEYVGCRWFTYDCSTWPTAGTINVPKLSRTYIPPLEYRTTDYPKSRDPDWAVRNKNNGTLPQLDEVRGGHITYQGFVHTFNGLVPPEQHFAAHPEWFSEIDGNRVQDHTQLCLTNKELLEFTIGRVREWIETNPSATIISVSQNDWHNYCQCGDCTALAEEEESQAGPLVHFVNAIAEDIEDDYPHIIIDTLAYQYTRKPPAKVKPVPNVAIRLCSIECCFIHALENDAYNATFVDDIVGWSKICNRLHIWDYVINYAHTIMPFPNLYVLRPNIDFFINHGVTGIYEEACYYTRGAELAELRTYVMAKTLWDPTYDTDAAIDEFCAAYYGDAGPYIRRFINLVHESAQSIPDMHVRIYSSPNVGYLTQEVLEESERLFNRAEAAVRNDPELLHRVEVARMPLLYSQISLAQSPTYLERDGRLISEATADIPRLARRFERIAKAEGCTRVREGGSANTVDTWLETLPMRQKGLEIVRIENGAMELSILPDLGGRIWRMQALGGRDIVKVYGEEGAWEPGMGGYEEYSESGYRSPGWTERYNVVEKTDTSIKLEAKLKNGIRLTREISLDPEMALVSITSTATNVTETEKSTTLRIHPAFQVASTQEASVIMSGGADLISLANQREPEAEMDRWLRGDAVPAGHWAIMDEQVGFGIHATFKPEQISHCLLNWNGADGRVNLELFSPETKLAPGESIVIEQTYEVQEGVG